MGIVVHLLSHFCTKRQRHMTLVVSTTGDTGPAAVRAVSDINNQLLSILVHFPQGQISSFQRKQMTTIHSSQVQVVTFQGGGDDMDLPIKRILTGTKAKTNEASDNGVCGVNSYNIGRPLMQAVHYVSCAVSPHSFSQQLVCTLTIGLRDDCLKGLDVSSNHGAVGKATRRSKYVCQPKQNTSQKDCFLSAAVFFVLVTDIQLDMVVPTGAMGNLAGGYMVKLMGLPLGKLCAVVNVNDITHRAIQRGEFFKSPGMIKTLSDAINIQVVRSSTSVVDIQKNESHLACRALMHTALQF